jgi:hypothetical protein
MATTLPAPINHIANLCARLFGAEVVSYEAPAVQVDFLTKKRPVPATKPATKATDDFLLAAPVKPAQRQKGRNEFGF